MRGIDAAASKAVLVTGRSEKCFKLFNFQSAGLREDNLTIQSSLGKDLYGARHR